LLIEVLTLLWLILVLLLELLRYLCLVVSRKSLLLVILWLLKIVTICWDLLLTKTISEVKWSLIFQLQILCRNLVGSLILRKHLIGLNLVGSLILSKHLIG
jgi:hypothetical protein